LKNYNGLNVPADYFNEAMNKLVNRYLNIPLDAVIHPLSSQAKKGATAQKAAIEKTAKVTEKDLSAEEWFEKGNKHADAYHASLKPSAVNRITLRHMQIEGMQLSKATEILIKH
jgi:hypothetical protein